MERYDHTLFEDAGTSLPTITLPPRVAASEEEKARRRALGKEADRLAQLAGPIGMSSSDLIRQIRNEAEDLTEEDESGD